MFLKLFEPIFAALMKNVKLTLLAILLAVLISWGISGEMRLKNKDEECVEERRSDRETIAVMADELRDTRKRLMDFAFGKVEIEKKAQENDSTLREQTKQDINKVLP